MASPIDLTTLADVKLFLGETSSASDGILALLITAASQYVATYCNRVFQSATYSEVYDGTGTSILLLRQKPVTAVTSVTVTGTAWNATASIYANGYTFDGINGVLYGMGGNYFPYIRRSVQVVYVAGYAVIPTDLSEAVNEMVADKFKRRSNIGVAARQIAGETISYTSGDVPKLAQRTLDLYQRAAPLA